MTREEMKIEAIERMKLLGIYPPTRRQFEQSGIVSESVPPLGACYWVEGEQLERVRKFEEKHNAVVFHVIHSYTDFGEIEDYLFVSKWKEEWGVQRSEAKNGIVFAYANNLTCPDCSEMGSIGVLRTPAAGLLRRW